MMKTLEGQLLLVLFLTAVVSSLAQECEYRYVRQPPPTLDCNSYERDLLALTCSAEGPPTPGFTIIWMRRRDGSDGRLFNSQQRIRIDTSNTDIAIDTNTNAVQTMRHSSRLSVSDIRNMDATGEYWCQVRLQNRTVLQKRSIILTFDDEAQYRGLPRCDGSHYVEKEECIHPLQVTLPVATDATDALTSDPGSEAQTTSPSTPSPQGTGDALEEPGGSKNLVALYAVVAVIVVFCLVIVTLSIIIVVLYRKKCGPVRFKTGDRRQTPNPYSGFTRERTSSNHSNVVSKSERSDSRLTNSGTHQQQTIGSPTSFSAHSEEEPYSRLVRDQTQNGGGAEMVPGYSKLDIPGAVPPLPPKPPSTKSNSKTPPPHTPLQTSPPAPGERQSAIYCDLTDTDIERGIRNLNALGPMNIYNTLESNAETPLSPDGHEYQELSPEGEKYDYGEEFNDWRISNRTEPSKVSTEKSLFDDPEYSPLKDVHRKDDIDPRYAGDYERSPTYTCPTVAKNFNGVDPKYRGDYERDPTYVTRRSPRRASCSAAGGRKIPKPEEIMKRRKSLEADALHKYTGDYEWSPNYVPVPLRNGSNGVLAVLDMPKYSGNYERDPVYMAHLLKKSAQGRQQRAQSVEYTIPGTVSQEHSIPPHFPHEYTQLEDNTRDPPQPYARLSSHSQTPDLTA